MHDILSGGRITYYLKADIVDGFVVQFVDLQLGSLVASSARFNKIVSEYTHAELFVFVNLLVYKILTFKHIFVIF